MFNRRQKWQKLPTPHLTNCSASLALWWSQQYCLVFIHTKPGKQDRLLSVHVIRDDVLMSDYSQLRCTIQSSTANCRFSSAIATNLQSGKIIQQDCFLKSFSATSSLSQLRSEPKPFLRDNALLLYKTCSNFSVILCAA